MRWIPFAVLLLHGSIHFMGFAKAWGVAELPQLTQGISKPMGVAWAIAGLLVVATAISLLAAPRSTWWVGLLALVASQAVIVTAWRDAKVGTVANVILLAVVVHGVASQGPPSLRAQYRRAVEARRAQASPRSAPLTEADLASLPEPVRCMLRAAGAVGRPRVEHFSARWRGRIRSTPDQPWMEFTAEQHNFVSEPARLFFMEARRGGLPVDVYHAFEHGSASMRVRLLSLVPLVHAHGAVLTRAETVTLLNDIAVMAPGALVDPAITWEALDLRSARATYTLGPNEVSAVLQVDTECRLVDFVSDDRLRLTEDGEGFVQERWSTPLRDHRAYGAVAAPAHGEARWHPPQGSYAYLELELLSLELDP